MDVPVECTRSDFDWLFGLFVSPFLHLVKSAHDIIMSSFLSQPQVSSEGGESENITAEKIENKKV